jgi:hypothetical protein
MFFEHLKFKILLKSGLGIEIGKFYAKTLAIFHKKPAKSLLFEKIEKSKLLVYSYFLADFY